MRTADEDIPVPEDLSRMIGRTVDRELGRRRGRMRLVASISSVAAAAAIAAVALIVPVDSYEPQDTFDDPQQAYTEVMKALEILGTNFNRGLRHTEDIVNRAIEPVDRVLEKYDDIN